MHLAIRIYVFVPCAEVRVRIMRNIVDLVLLVVRFACSFQRRESDTGKPRTIARVQGTN